MIYRNRFTAYVAALIAVSTITLASCSAPNGPVASGGASYGVLSNKDMSEYYYPREAGWTYVYKHTITEYSNGGNSVSATYSGPYDTLRTLGYIGKAPTGDSMFAFSVTYRLLESKNNKNRFQLYYFPKGGNANTGGFVKGNNRGTLTGLDSISSVAGAIDTILYVTEGPTRDVVDDYASNGNRVYRKDIIYFTAYKDSVKIWWKDGTVMRSTRIMWQRDFNKNDDWAYAQVVGDPYTWFQVDDEDQTISVDAGSFTCARIEAFTDRLNTSTQELKYWGSGTGLVKQYDEWRVSSDGQSFDKRTRVRELVSRTKAQ